MKTCGKCKIEKYLSEFNKHCRMKDGLRSTCKQCDKEYRISNKDSIKKYNSKRYQDNLDKYREKRMLKTDYHKEYMKAWRKKNTDYDKNWSQENKEHRKIYRREYYLKNKDNINNNRRKYLSNRILNDNLFKLKCDVRRIILHAFKIQGYIKKSKTQEMLGCTFEELKQHLESKFEPWMSWNNKGKYNGLFNYGWDIDHIIPLSSASTEEEIIKLNHYTNLQPLCSKVNRDIKKDKIDYERRNG